MISVNLSINQLIEAIQNLNEAEKKQVRAVLDDDDLSLSDQQKQQILDREMEYKSGRMKLYTVAELKARLNFRD